MCTSVPKSFHHEIRPLNSLDSPFLPQTESNTEAADDDLPVASQVQLGVPDSLP